MYTKDEIESVKTALKNIQKAVQDLQFNLNNILGVSADMQLRFLRAQREADEDLRQAETGSAEQVGPPQLEAREPETIDQAMGREFQEVLGELDEDIERKRAS